MLCFLSSRLFDNMWWKAIVFACYILNKVPNNKLDQAPCGPWKGYTLNLNFLRV